MSGPATNPFQPGNGTVPPLLAGRDAEVGLADRLLDQLAAGRRPPQDVLLYGPRGNGKTALLLRIAEAARARGFRVQDLPPSELEDRSSLIGQLQEYAGLTGARVTGANVGPVGVSTEPGQPGRDARELLAAWIGQTGAPLVVLADEFHAVRPAVGTAFLNAVQATKGVGRPFLLVAAGTPDTPARIRRMGTHNERGFRARRIGRLDRSATVEALAEPARSAGRPMTVEAADALAEESQDYPYFIQLLGSAAWDTAERLEAGDVTETAARDAIAETREEIASFYGARYMEAERRGVAPALVPVASLMTARAGWVGYGELKPVLVEIAAENPDTSDPITLFEILSDLGVIWETADDHWEMGIPSFARYVLSRTAPHA